MAVRMVKCKYCGIQFNRNAEPFVEVGGRRYAHKACADQHQASIPQEEKDYQALEDYIKKLFKEDYLNAKIKKQIKDFRQEYKYTFSGMLWKQLGSFLKKLHIHLPTVSASKLTLLTAQQASKLRDKLLGQEMVALFGKLADREAGGLVS